jgi:hypothetical protein
VTLMLLRQRQLAPDASDGSHHAGLAAAIMTLPSGLLALISKAVVNVNMNMTMIEFETHLKVHYAFFLSAMRAIGAPAENAVERMMAAYTGM